MRLVVKDPPEFSCKSCTSWVRLWSGRRRCSTIGVGRYCPVPPGPFPNQSGLSQPLDEQGLGIGAGSVERPPDTASADVDGFRALSSLARTLGRRHRFVVERGPSHSATDCSVIGALSSLLRPATAGVK